MPLPLTTERLVIRRLTEADAEDVFAVYGDPEVLRFWNSPPLSGLASARAWAHEQDAGHRARGYAQWHVSLLGDGEFIGCVGLQPLGDGEVEIVYALRPPHWGHGYATEAGRAALRVGFIDAGLAEIVGIVREENLVSRRTILRIGLCDAGVGTYFGREWKKYVLRREDWLVAERGPAGA